MKTKLVLIAAMFAALVSSAQTNSIIFPQLLSSTNSVLMTNAEFRCYSGDKIFFRNDSTYQSFHAADLNTNVLNALGTSPAKLKAQQQALDASHQQYKTEVAAVQAEQERQKKLLIQRNQQAEADAARRRAEYQAENANNARPPNHVTDRGSIGLGE